MNQVSAISIPFKKAEELYKLQQYELAISYYLEVTLSSLHHLAAFSMFRLGEIYNHLNLLEKSLEFHNAAFKKEPELAKIIIDAKYPHHRFIYKPTEEFRSLRCPLCLEPSTLASVHNLLVSADFLPGFNPIREWGYCAKCQHIHAINYPKNLEFILKNHLSRVIQKPILERLPLFSPLFETLSSLNQGKRLLEIGIGAGELSAVALEFGYNVEGIDIREAYANNAAKTLGIPCHCISFDKFPAKTFDVIIMGDVLEHLQDPESTILRCYDMLCDQGILWISTPNHQSAHSRLMLQDDPMLKVCDHLHYFSRNSLEILLKKYRFQSINYSMSRHYNGSMEILCKKS